MYKKKGNKERRRKKIPDRYIRALLSSLWRKTAKRKKALGRPYGTRARAKVRCGAEKFRPTWRNEERSGKARGALRSKKARNRAGISRYRSLMLLRLSDKNRPGIADCLYFGKFLLALKKEKNRAESRARIIEVYKQGIRCATIPSIMPSALRHCVPWSCSSCFARFMPCEDVGESLVSREDSSPIAERRAVAPIRLAIFKSPLAASSFFHVRGRRKGKSSRVRTRGDALACFQTLT